MRRTIVILAVLMVVCLGLSEAQVRRTDSRIVVPVLTKSIDCDEAQGCTGVIKEQGVSIADVFIRWSGDTAQVRFLAKPGFKLSEVHLRGYDGSEQIGRLDKDYPHPYAYDTGYLNIPESTNTAKRHYEGMCKFKAWVKAVEVLNDCPLEKSRSTKGLTNIDYNLPNSVRVTWLEDPPKCVVCAPPDGMCCVDPQGVYWIKIEDETLLLNGERWAWSMADPRDPHTVFSQGFKYFGHVLVNPPFKPWKLHRVEYIINSNFVGQQANCKDKKVQRWMVQEAIWKILYNDYKGRNGTGLNCISQEIVDLARANAGQGWDKCGPRIRLIAIAPDTPWSAAVKYVLLAITEFAEKPCDTPTPTQTATHTPTSTWTPRDTPTWTPTPRDTPTDTPTPRETPTDTPTPRDTPTDTPTPRDTPTDTPTPRDTPTDTPTPRDTPTNTPTYTATPCVWQYSEEFTTGYAYFCCCKPQPCCDGKVKWFTLKNLGDGANLTVTERDGDEVFNGWVGHNSNFTFDSNGGDFGTHICVEDTSKSDDCDQIHTSCSQDVSIGTVWLGRFEIIDGASRNGGLDYCPR